MFPDAYHRPAFQAELPSHLFVPALISRDLHLPVWPVAARQSKMMGTCVPETTIYEDDNPGLPKNKVWVAFEREMPPPPNDSVSTKERKEGSFRGGVAA